MYVGRRLLYRSSNSPRFCVPTDGSIMETMQPAAGSGPKLIRRRYIRTRMRYRPVCQFEAVDVGAVGPAFRWIAPDKTSEAGSY